MDTALALIQNDDPLIDTARLAAETGTTIEFWEALRTKGGGPDFIKVGRLVRYRRSAVDAWFERRTVRSTTQARALRKVGEAA
ncbi:helix-turn-helix transcriptional regulator [Methylocystis parvus]|uniref:helix-turn-helix transcriptional regulator n=1 Tax=Methylocystis parvus TaxID=134 RepID=UPI003C70DB0B